MTRWIYVAVSSLAMMLPWSSADASGDYGCDPSWKLASDSYGSCGNRAVLSPGNDTRVNLFYLLRDRQGAGSTGLTYPKIEYGDRTLGNNFFSWGLLRKAYYPAEPDEVQLSEHYGSRCISLASGGQAFAAAMQASRKLPAAERGALSAARMSVAGRCAAGGAAGGNWPTIASAPGKEFLAYLHGADAFYGENWGAARETFARLRGAGDPWVAETAAYMLARADLNAAQANSFDEYGSFAGPEKTDRAALARAKAGFDDYLERYAKGRYAGSARGLIRRVLWLGGDAEGLAREYEHMLAATAAATPQAADLVEEIDNKLLLIDRSRSQIDGPLLLAAVDLMMMRDAEDSGLPIIAAEALAAQEPRFAGRADLFAFVTASHAYYVGKDMRRVLQLIPDDAKKPGYSPLAFSRQVLRGMALAALKDRNEAGFWRDLLGGATALYQRPVVELALAMNYERSGRLADVFAAGSPIGESAIREILLQHVAGPDLLRAQAQDAARPQHERDLALFTLLYKRLTHGDYAGYLRDAGLVRAAATSEGGIWNLRMQEDIPLGLFREGKWAEGYSCPTLAASVASLSRNAKDVKARLCLGEFYRLNGFDYLEESEEAPAADELGGSASLFPGKAMTRGPIYAAVIADPLAAPGDKAYALFRAVNCYAPGGNNSCGGADVPESQRKAWYQQLKRDYPQSEWARQLRYYW